MLTRTRTIAAIGAAALAGAGAGVGVYATVDGGSPTPVAATTTVAAPSTAAVSTTGLSVHDVYAKAGPGTVEVIANGTSSASPFPGQGQSQAQGSGFVYDASGHVVTNEHVVDGASSFRVRFPNGKTVAATLVGADPSTDLAVLKVDAPASQLHPIALADSAQVQVGDGVVAIGSPFGLENTVTTGIVSAVHRQIAAPNNFTIDDAIQTDAAINHGNSGGPLLDMEGRLIGVNAQINSESGGNDGVGFAIPSNTVRQIVGKLVASGSVRHAYLGVGIQPAANGAEVTDVNAGTPAADAGLRVGDVITGVDGKSVDSNQLRAAIDAHAPGDTVTLTYQRSGQAHTVKVTLGSRPS